MDTNMGNASPNAGRSQPRWRADLGLAGGLLLLSLTPAAIALMLGIAGVACAQPVSKARPVAGAADYANMTFQGVYRSDPKTHFAKSSNGARVATEAFNDLTSLKATLMPDKTMWAKYPKIAHPNDFANARVAEELRNVSVIAYIHAVALENGIAERGTQSAETMAWGIPDGYMHRDLDFHVMLGTSPRHGEGTFLAAEVSGLPRDGIDMDDFKRARQQIVDILLNVAKKPESSFHAKFAAINPPIKVKVTGSLLFDGDHAAGQFEPNYAKPSTAWEIHPVMSIELQ